MAKKEVILHCRYGNKKSGDKVSLEEKVADGLIAIKRASEVKSDETKSSAKAKA